MRQQGLPLLAKRLIDRGVAAAALVALSPVLATTAVAVRIKLGSPVLFRQRRPGYKGRTFELVKFRTMLDARTPSGELLPDSERLTPFGRFLRSSSLDELPELWNVLKGEMSLVGPRPLLIEYLPRYNAEQARRHDVLPGITGWAQISGRNALNWEEKFALDVWYVDNWSLGLDVWILAKTVLHLIKPTGISHAGHETMPVFAGTT